MEARSENTPIQPSVGEKIKAARKAKGWTQVDLAARAGLSQRWVSDIERRDTKSPRLTTLIALAEVLDLDVADLVISAEMAKSRSEAQRLIAEIADVDDPLLDAIMLDVRSLTPEGRRRARAMVVMIREMEADQSNGGSEN